jgi:hypothetical protein
MFQLLKQKPKTDKPERARWVIFIVIAVLSSALLVRFVDWAVLPPRSLLTQAPGLVELANVENLSTYSLTSIALPTNIVGAELFIVGIYTQPNDVFPADTISLVYTKNNWRAFEIDYLPGRTIKEQSAILSGYDQEEVVLNETTSATIVTRNEKPRCINYEDGLPNKCEITNQLLFTRDGLLISISADGTHATQGELVEIAKSILNQKATK